MIHLDEQEIVPQTRSIEWIYERLSKRIGEVIQIESNMPNRGSARDNLAGCRTRCGRLQWLQIDEYGRLLVEMGNRTHHGDNGDFISRKDRISVLQDGEWVVIYHPKGFTIGVAQSVESRRFSGN